MGISEVISRLDQKLAQTRHKYRQYFIIYTILFALVCGLVFCWYYVGGRTLIWSGDGWNQHIKSLTYFAKYLRSIIKGLLFNHQLSIPEWDFALGEGNDILQSLHWEVIGDPFTLLSVFVPTKFMYLYFDASMILRLYISGLAFSWLCFYTRKNISRFGVLAGSLVYVFCYWAIYNAARHPYFLNPMIYFPLLIVGMEKIIRGERSHVFILTVFISAVSHFYFFYMLAILTAMYGLIRLSYKAYSEREFKINVIILLKLLGAAIVGAVMACAILFPMLYTFLSDARLGNGNPLHLLYSLSYYSRLPGLFISEGDTYWTSMGYAAPAVIAVFLLFLRKKKNVFLKICFVACIVIMLIPAFGQALNGFSYMTNRWSWAIALISAYIFAVMWQELTDLYRKDWIRLFICMSAYYFVCLMLEYSRTLKAFAAIGLAFIFLIIIMPTVDDEKNHQQLLMRQVSALLIVIVGVGLISFFKNSSAEDDYAASSVETEEITDTLKTNETKAVSKSAASDDVTEFYRYSGRNLTANAGLLSGLSSTAYYWSISNPFISGFRSDMELLETSVFNYKGYDDRAALLSLSSVLYYVVPEDDEAPLPYGFTYVDELNVKEDITKEAEKLLKEELGLDKLSDDQIEVIEDATASTYKVYRNDNALPLAYTYNTLISEDEWSALSAVEKQEAMLQGVYLADYDDDRSDIGSAFQKLNDTGADSAGSDIDLTSKSLDYSVKCKSSGVTLEDYGFVVTSAKSQVTLSFEGLENCETYLRIKGLDFDGVSTYELYFGDDKYDPLNLYTKTRWDLLSHADQESARRSALFWSEPTGADITVKASSGVSKTINYKTEDYSYYNDRHDFSVNLDYSEDAVTSITLTFSAVGVYSFDDIEIVCQPMQAYETQIAALKEYAPNDIKIGTDKVTGSVSLDADGILCFSIPYSKGWTAYVDGEKVKLYQANIKNMALVLDAGEHDFKLVYHTPYLRIGILISLAGFALFGAILIVNRKRRIRRATKSGEYISVKNQDIESKGGEPF